MIIPSLHDKKVFAYISSAVLTKISAVNVMPHSDAASFCGERCPFRKDPGDLDRLNQVQDDEVRAEIFVV